MLSPVQRMKLHQKVDFILHTPGNYRGGILEMTIVMDAALSKEECKIRVLDVLAALKAHSPIFRNVRLNVAYWDGTEKIENQVMGMAVLQMGTYFNTYQQVEKQKTIDLLFKWLKVFHARSKLVMVFTNQNVDVEDAKQVVASLNPFLKQKLLWLQNEQVIDGREIQMKCLRE